MHMTPTAMMIMHLRVYGRFHFSELISKCLQQQLLKELKKKRYILLQ